MVRVMVEAEHQEIAQQMAERLAVIVRAQLGN
jgi:phosphoglucosamine mutase